MRSNLNGLGETASNVAEVEMRRALVLLALIASSCLPPAEFVPDPLVQRRGPPRESVDVVERTPPGARLAGVLSANGPSRHEAILKRAAAEGCQAVYFHVVYEASPDLSINGGHLIGDCLVYR
jgi:hypothetical protein